MEHHSNIVPWQIVCEEKGAVLKVIPINDRGELLMEAYQDLLSDNTKLVSVMHVSNALGTINPIQEIIDAAQSILHIDIDVQELNCDFLAFSSHKLLGPTGMGVLYGKKDILNQMPPFNAGGEMIREVSFAKTTYNDLPYKFEAGTPNIADAIAFKAAIDYINTLGKEWIRNHEAELLNYATGQISQIEGVRIIGTAKNKISVLSFVIDGIHPSDMGVLLDNKGIAVRTGHHCAEPLMARFNIPGTIRASFALYNTKEEIDVFVAGLKKAISVLL